MRGIRIAALTATILLLGTTVILQANTIDECDGEIDMLQDIVIDLQHSAAARRG